MKYAYEDLSPEQFEKLILLLCQKLFGISVQGFASGPDGGRDAKFVGKANLHPSEANPWEGTTIIQAKHTNGYNKHFAEPDFFSTTNKNCIIAKEIPKIKKLKENKQLDNYILFANRRLTGGIESEIRKFISDECAISEQCLYLCGIEQIENFMRIFPNIAKTACLDPIDSPLLIEPNDLAEVIQALAKCKQENIEPSIDFSKNDIVRTSYEIKNKLNNMSDEYSNEIRKKYLKETPFISRFLASPENKEMLELYNDVVDDFQLKIIAKRKDYQSFDEVMNYIFNFLFGRDPILKQKEHKKLTKVILFYMYWNCDIGRSGDAATD